jgi:tetratricopeptide (TPR) repeat protein
VASSIRRWPISTGRSPSIRSWPGAYADRGRAYELKGDRDQAIADYRKALSLKSRQLYDDKAKAAAKKQLAALGAAAVSDSALPNSRADQAANPKEPGTVTGSP